MDYMDYKEWDRLTRTEKLDYVKTILPQGDKWDILFRVISNNHFGSHQLSHDSYHYPSLNSNVGIREESIISMAMLLMKS